MALEALHEQAKVVLEACRSRGLHIVTAESCTGGLIIGALTEIAGSSDVVDRGFVTYTNESKEELLGVPHASLDAHGAVSAQVACAMAEGALAHAASAQLSVAVTGIAGPGGATPTKPVGLVFIASARKGSDTRCERHVFSGDRAAIRVATVARALALLTEQARSS